MFFGGGCKKSYCKRTSCQNATHNHQHNHAHTIRDSHTQSDTRTQNHEHKRATKQTDTHTQSSKHTHKNKQTQTDTQTHTRTRTQTKNLESIGVRDRMGGQGRYRVGRGSIGWAGAVSAVPPPEPDFQLIKKVFLRCFFGWLGPKN